MAGVVAMASVIEDFDTQPCKKSRKDGGSPVVKTITNYFSPVAKPAEKPFSPPRSNNIKDYFSRMPLSSKEKNSPSEQSKENCQTSQSKDKCASLEAAVKQPSQKRSRKAVKAARKLVESETVEAAVGCLIVNEPHQIKDSIAEAKGACGVLGSETASRLAQPSTVACNNAEAPESSAAMAVDVARAEEEKQVAGSRCGHRVKLKKKRSVNSSPVLPSGDQATQVHTDAPNLKRRHQQEATKPRLDEMETETSVCVQSTEGNVDGAPQSNTSTVTISFEDFVRSQGDGKVKRHQEEESRITADEEDLLKSALSAEPVLQVSPRTVTIQAEVHAVSPQQEAATDAGKVASIFNRRKEISPPDLETGQELPSTLLTVKRKSNVVLLEEDFELAIIESESTAKCSEAERKQFMAAFKRPSAEVSKTKPGKSQSRQKQPGEKNADAADKDQEEDGVVTPSMEQVPAAAPGNRDARKKPARRGRKKAKSEEKNQPADGPHTPAAPPSPPPPAVDALATCVDVDADDDKGEPAVPALRRSRREAAAVRQSAETATETSLQRSANQKEPPVADAAATSPGRQAMVPTPKTRRSKHGVFVAQMVCPPDRNESPIRIKFTRVHRNVSTSKGERGSGLKTMATKTPDNESKKRKQAKKLVEKAKVMQHSRKSLTEGKDAVRRSSRKETSKSKSYCENEDSVICLEESSTSPPTAPVRAQTQKPLRSLNEVLGKAASVRETRATPGSRVAMLGQDAAARKASAVISIFDDSSREGSENSQDDEQFKARRDFLKSGLPDSFRKQLAKTTATKEAYSLSCSSFQPVVHVKQPPNDCSLWALPWPESSLLCQLEELCSQAPPPTSSVGVSCCLKTEPARRAFCERGSGWRPEICESVRQLLIEEVSTSNPSFPAQRFISRFLKRRADHQQHCAASVETATSGGGKRKRIDEEGAKVAKKQRGNQSEENASVPGPTKTGGRPRRAQRPKAEKEAKGGARSSPLTTPTATTDDCVVVLDDLVLVEDAVEKDVVKEDVLWTEKYQPQHSGDIIGNTASVRRLHSWLKEWKLRADREERKKQKEKKQQEGSHDSDWDCAEEDSQDSEDMLCNTVLITGPTGVGKTAAVYACAQELGFKVFEVNASSQRSGRLILSQLREATQSHQVDSQGVNAHKPTYFNSYSSSAGTLKPGSSPRKVNSPRRVVSSPRKHPQSPRGAKRGSLAPTALAKFFKMGQPINPEPKNTKKTEEKEDDSKKVVKGIGDGANNRKDLEDKPPAASTLNEGAVEQGKKTATSLILFEEVDVIFEEDSGFLAAIKTFMTTTKRPVILTTSDPSFSTMFDGHFEEIHFKTPSLLNVGTYLQLLCLAEDVRTEPSNVRSLLKLNGCDIRQSLLQLQFWTRSAGGRRVARPLARPDDDASNPSEPESAVEAAAAAALPACDSGCTESRLGLHNVRPDTDIWELFRAPNLDEAVCRELLMDSRRRGVDLLYSNMEALLPLPRTRLTRAILKPSDRPPPGSQDLPCVEPKQEPPSAAALPQLAESADGSDDGSRVKVSNRMKRNKRRHALAESVQSDSDSEESFLSLCKPAGAPEAVAERPVTQARDRKPLAPGERLKSVPVSQCLDSLADFMDSMSFVDSSLLLAPEGRAASGGTSTPAAAVKDGMTDEPRAESERGSWARVELGLEIQATVEAMSFHKCRVSVAEAWHRAQQLEGELRDGAAEELTLPVAPHCGGYSFSQDGPCPPQLVHRRREAVETLTLRGLVGTLGNRAAAALDYLPALRTICRSEQLKERGKVKRRFLHYLDAIHLGLDKNTLQQLAEDFP